MNKKIIFKQKELKFYIKAVLIFLLFTFIVALLIGVYFFQNMEDLIGRTSQVSVFETENPVQALIKSATLHLGMFNFYGDPNWRHNYSVAPMLPFALGILFILRLAISIKKLFQALKEKKLSRNDFSRNNFLLVFYNAGGGYSYYGRDAPLIKNYQRNSPTLYISGFGRL